jgi:hypothetical protein
MDSPLIISFEQVLHFKLELAQYSYILAKYSLEDKQNPVERKAF